MPRYVAERLEAQMAKASIAMAGARILVMGLAFKENCSDVRNTKVADVIAVLRERGARVDVFDPCVDADSVDETLLAMPAQGVYDAVLVAVAHDAFRDLGTVRIRAFGKPRSVVFDVKHLLAGRCGGRTPVDAHRGHRRRRLHRFVRSPSSCSNTATPCSASTT